MGEYGSGITLGDMFNNDKERIRMALDGKLVVGEDSNGFIYEAASKQECEEYIISAYENAVYHALQGYRSGRVLERILNETPFAPKGDKMLKKYMRYTFEEEQKDSKRIKDRFIYEDETSIEPPFDAEE